MARDVPSGHLERSGRDVRGHDARLGPGACRQHREAARAGAQVEHAARRREILQQEGDVRAGDNHPFVDVERHAIEPRFLQEIGCWNALADSLSDEVFDFFRSNFPVQIEIERKPQPPQNKKRGLIAGVAGSVPVVQAGGLESLLGLGDQLPELQGSRARRVSR